MNADDLARAKQIAAELKQMSPGSYMAKIVCILLEMVEGRDRQIAALKAACHKYCQKSIYLDHRDRSLESAGIAATSQLAREMSEIDWEEKR